MRHFQRAASGAGDDEEEEAIAPADRDGAQLRGLDVVEGGDAHAVPAGIVRGAGGGGAGVDGFGGVGAAHEVEPVAILAGVPGEPEGGRGDQHGGKEDEGAAGAGVAGASAKHGAQSDEPDDAGEDPAVVAGVDGGDEDEAAGVMARPARR